jgi:hypothetical protein
MKVTHRGKNTGRLTLSGVIVISSSSPGVEVVVVLEAVDVDVLPGTVVVTPLEVVEVETTVVVEVEVVVTGIIMTEDGSHSSWHW